MFRVRTLQQRPGLVRDFVAFHRTAWPSFLRDDRVSSLWPRLYATFPEFQFGLFDEEDRTVAVGNTIPFVWNGKPATLPLHIANAMANGVDAYERAEAPTALCGLAAIVRPSHRGTKLSARVVATMGQLAAGHGLRRVVVPVRPFLKGQYPLTPMETYARWRRPDGSPFDPWVRVHWRLGARIVRITPRGNTVRATVADWERWTGLRFPQSGRYIVPGAFRPITVDRERDRVHYEEANLWMRHRVPPARQRAPRRSGTCDRAGGLPRRRRDRD